MADPRDKLEPLTYPRWLGKYTSIGVKTIARLMTLLVFIFSFALL